MAKGDYKRKERAMKKVATLMTQGVPFGPRIGKGEDTRLLAAQLDPANRNVYTDNTSMQQIPDRKPPTMGKSKMTDYRKKYKKK